MNFQLEIRNLGADTVSCHEARRPSAVSKIAEGNLAITYYLEKQLRALVVRSSNLHSPSQVDGEMILLPEGPLQVAEVLRRALTDDALVDRAAEINAGVAAEKLEYSMIQGKAIENYQTVAAGRESGE